LRLDIVPETKIAMPRNNLINRAFPWIAAVTGGVLYFLGYAGFDRFYLEWVFLVPVLWAIREKTPGRAFLIGWVAGIVTQVGGFYWIIGMFREFAGMAWPLACLGLLFFAVLNGAIFAAWAWATRLITRDTGWSATLVAPVVWTAVEKFWLEIFPNYLGASQYRLTLLTQIADVTGILGVTFLVVYINSTIYGVIELWLEKRRFAWRQTAVFAAVIAAVLVYGGLRIRAVDRQTAFAPKMTIGIVQTNLGAGNKRNNPENVLLEHQAMSGTLAATHSLDLIVWPESVCGIERTSQEGELPPALLDGLRTPLLFGAVQRLWEGETPRLYNSALLADGRGKILGVYDKMVLVPFGEYIPFGDTFPQLYSWLPQTGRFRQGENEEPLLMDGRVLSVSICYEDIFPGQIRSLMRGGRDSRIPEVMFNLTNDSWYGKSVEPMEHLALASFRSIEHRRSLVRATNTGVSAFVDPVGRLANRSGLWSQQTLVDLVPLMHGRTIYALLGDWIGWVCGILSIFGLGRAIRVSRCSKVRRQPLHDRSRKDRG
jgi:apolipoprotein N-acyltransferase